MQSSKNVSYRLLNCCLRKRTLFITLCLLFLLTIILSGAAFVVITHYINISSSNSALKYNIEQSMKGDLMIDCDYVVTPWFLNLCESEDLTTGYAWRQFKLLTTYNPDCTDVHERILCHDDDKFEAVKNREKVFPNACPLFNRLEDVEKIVKAPLIRDLSQYKNKILRSKDVFLMCSNCALRGCEDNVPAYILIRHGWPYSFAGCSFDYDNAKICK